MNLVALVDNWHFVSVHSRSLEMIARKIANHGWKNVRVEGTW